MWHFCLYTNHLSLTFNLMALKNLFLFSGSRILTKLERGNSNPSIRTLQRLAAGMGMSIQLKFIPNGNA